MEAVVWGEVLVDKIEELFANICFNFHVLRRIEPGDVSFSCSWFLAVWLETLGAWSMPCKVNAWLFSKPRRKME